MTFPESYQWTTLLSSHTICNINLKHFNFFLKKISIYDLKTVFLYSYKNRSFELINFMLLIPFFGKLFPFVCYVDFEMNLCNKNDNSLSPTNLFTTFIFHIILVNVNIKNFQATSIKNNLFLVIGVIENKMFIQTVL